MHKARFSLFLDLVCLLQEACCRSSSRALERARAAVTMSASGARVACGHGSSRGLWMYTTVRSQLKDVCAYIFRIDMLLVFGRSRIPRHLTHSRPARFAATRSHRMETQKYLDVALDAAKAAGQVILDAWDKPRNVQHKGTADLVCVGSVIRQHVDAQQTSLVLVNTYNATT